MATPNIAKWLQYESGQSSPFNIKAGSTPTFVAVVTHPNLPPTGYTVYLRLWSWDNRFITWRTMTYTNDFGGSPVFKYASSYNAAGPNTKIRIAYSGSISGGSVRLRWNEIYTAPIKWTGQTLAQQLAAVESHPDIGKGNVTFTWDGSGHVIEFVGRLAHINLSGFSILNELTGASPTVSVSVVTSGSGDFARDQESLQWDVVAKNNSGSLPYTGDKASLRQAIAGTQMKFWTDFPAGVQSISPGDSAVVPTAIPTLSFSFSSGTIVSIPVTKQTLSIKDSAGNIAYQYNVEGANLNSVTAFKVPLEKKLKDGQFYTWKHEIWKQSGAYTTFSKWFQVDYARPAVPTGVTGVAHSSGAYYEMHWSVSALSDANFVGYVAKWRDAGAAEDSDDNHEVFFTSDKTRNYAYLMVFPRNRDIIVSFYVRQIDAFGDVVDSQPKEFSVFVPLSAVIIASPYNRRYVELRAYDGERAVPYLESPNYYYTWNRDTPIASPSATRSRSVQFTAVLEGDRDEQRIAWEMIEEFYINEPAWPLVYADAFGFCFQIWLNAPTPSKSPGRGKHMRVAISGREVAAVDATGLPI